MRIALGSDHAGVTLRREVQDHLSKRGHQIHDCGAHSSESTDYPTFAADVAGRVARGEADLGVLVCGTGIGMSMAANKVLGVRAALCCNELMGRMARLHNDANVLCLGQRVVGTGLALSIVDAFVDTRFEGGRHQRRVDQIRQLEKA